MKKLSERKKKWIERTVANDRSNKRFLYNRFYLFAVLVLLQIVGMFFGLYLFAYDSSWGLVVQAAVGILALVIVLYIINKNDRLSYKLNWILLVLIVPVFGVPFYLFFGDGTPIRRMKKKISRAQAENNRQLLEKYGVGRRTPCQPQLPKTRAEGFSYYLQTQVGYPSYSDGDIAYYHSGETAFPEIKAELKKAEKFILLEYFIIAHGKMWGDILKILLEKANEGVQIRIIYDDFGCLTTLPPDYENYLESLHPNIRAMAFNQVVPVFDLRMNNRDHRKIIVVDGKVAFTGGINVADEYIGQKRRFGYWKDSCVKITGGGVQSFTRMFFDIWNAFRKDKEVLSDFVLPALNADLPPSSKEMERIIQPFDDSPMDKQSVGEHGYADMINRAVRYVYIFTPYLLPGDTLRLALIRAAERGVDVRIVTPGIPDKKTIYRLTRANYAVLLDAGVKIYEYTPGFIHSKSLLCDGECAIVGTINFDYRSLYLHFEDGVYFSGCDALQDLKRDCEETFAVSKQCTKESVKRGVLGRLADSILRIFETLM